MRQASWVERTLRRYSTTVYQCHFCGANFITDTWFALHLYHEHGVRDPIVVRFIGDDSDAHKIEWAHRATTPRNKPSAAS